MRIVYLGHATTVIEAAGQALVTDPVLSPRVARFFTKRTGALAYEDGRPVTALLISHAHHDHLDWPSLARLGRGLPVLVPWGVAPGLRFRGHRDVRTLRPWDEAALGDVRVTAVPAKHFGGRLPLVGTSGYQGYVVAARHTAYFAGDTGFDAAMFRAIGERFAPDVAILPIAGYVTHRFRRHHMDAADALEAFRLLGARVLIPVHFETFHASFEPIGEPRRRLLAEAVRRGVADAVVFLRSGEGHDVAPRGPLDRAGRTGAPDAPAGGLR